MLVLNQCQSNMHDVTAVTFAGTNPRMLQHQKPQLTYLEKIILLCAQFGNHAHHSNMQQLHFRMAAPRNIEADVQIEQPCFAQSCECSCFVVSANVCF